MSNCCPLWGKFFYRKRQGEEHFERRTAIPAWFSENVSATEKHAWNYLYVILLFLNLYFAIAIYLKI